MEVTPDGEWGFAVASGDGWGGGYLEVDAAALLLLGLGLLRRPRAAAIRSPHGTRAAVALRWDWSGPEEAGGEGWRRRWQKVCEVLE